MSPQSTTSTDSRKPVQVQVTDKTAIRPFQVNFPEAELSELRAR